MPGEKRRKKSYKRMIGRGAKKRRMRNKKKNQAKTGTTAKAKKKNE